MDVTGLILIVMKRVVGIMIIIELLVRNQPGVVGKKVSGRIARWIGVQIVGNMEMRVLLVKQIRVPGGPIAGEVGVTIR